MRHPVYRLKRCGSKGRADEGSGLRPGQRVDGNDVVALLAVLDRAVSSRIGSHALTPIFLWMVPLAVIAVVILFFAKERPLGTTVENDTPSEAISEGNILITADEDEVTVAAP